MQSRRGIHAEPAGTEQHGGLGASGYYAHCDGDGFHEGCNRGQVSASGDGAACVLKWMADENGCRFGERKRGRLSFRLADLMAMDSWCLFFFFIFSFLLRCDVLQVIEGGEHGRK